MTLLIQGGHVIDPGRVNGVADVLIENGTISAVGPALTAPAGATVIQAKGQLVLPGFVDLHVHFREPGFEYKETIQSGTAAAVAGGFTTVCAMPNTNPVNDNQAVTEFMLERAKAAGNAHLYPIGAITKKSEGKELAEIGDLRRAGCVAISDDGKPVMNSLVMRRAMEYARAFDVPVVDHCEDLHLSEGGCMNEGLVSTELGLPGIPSAAEDVMVARNVSLAELTGARLHLAHISTAGSVRMVREAKARGLKVTAEACPHHFTLTEELTRGYNTHAKMNPPLRTMQDVQAIKEGLRDGTIDVIATDHAPHATQEKQQEFTEAPFGIVGLETALSLTLALVDEGVLTLESAVDKLATAPAKAFSLNAGTLAVGAPADVAIVDPNREWQVDPSRFRSKSRNTPFAGWKVKGRVTTTIVSGRVVFELDRSERQA
ncbi:MAG: dihydroorotase [Nitrospira sp.]|jgi:dihydroorotase|uniref:dihydroorotase n=1 Tax=Nitrospira sp. ND1 TaxID=1658518 RepID=UPI0009B95C59|nr:dihydroorotase [Nitrospira sp. ND1]MBK7420628.1 dihydroorotase [Nitrospira sp.]MDQ1291302.1 dihydroorotase [Nitrospirota bacterium]OYT22115.1 MAG: dihydroorotase [Nitrospira sp. UW-LDO-02]MBK7485840.1 dihydroorotase [Nitrospira sp.]MBK8378901.1 dihydroorotase [Nitrospira sp.]